MKLSDNYMLSEIGDKTAAIPIGQNVADMSKIITLNPTGAFICECLQNELSLDELRNRLYTRYECEESERHIIDKDIDDFVAFASAIGLIRK